MAGLHAHIRSRTSRVPLRFPVVGTGVLGELPQDRSISIPSAGGHGMASRVRQSPGPALCQMGAHGTSPTALRWPGRPPQLRAGLHGATAVDRLWDGGPGIHLPTAGG